MNSDKIVTIFCVVMVTASFILLCFILPSNTATINNMNNEAKLQYVLESNNNMINKEKYNLSKTICEQKINKTFEESFWIKIFGNDKNTYTTKCRINLLK